MRTLPPWTRSRHSQQGSPSDHEPMPNIQGPITRARARQLNYQVKLFLVSHKLVTENRLLPNNVLLVRNLDKDQLWCVNAPTQAITKVGDAKGFSSAINYHSNLNCTKRMQTDSVWGVWPLVGKLISYTFQWIQAHYQIRSELEDIIKEIHDCWGAAPPLMLGWVPM